MVKLKLTDDVTKRCCRKIFDCRNRAFNAVCIELRVCNLIENDRVDLHGNVILCDNGLRRKINNLLFKRNISCNSLKERDFKMNTRLPCLAICAETFNNICS